MRFLRVRCPPAFIVATGERPSDDLLAYVREQTTSLGYSAWADDDRLIAGATDVEPMAWPTFLLSGPTTDVAFTEGAELTEDS